MPTLRVRRLLPLLLLIAFIGPRIDRSPLAAPALAQQPSSQSQPGVSYRDPAFVALPRASASFGEYAGGVYRIEIPAGWNGGLVMFAHGYAGEGTVAAVGNPPIREHLIAGGYAWAASSFRGNGYRPDWGVDDTLALRQLFVEQHGEPRWTILYGQSMGGHIVTASLELHPAVYQAALPECGVLTGIGVIDYLAAYTAAAEYISGVPLLSQPDPAALTSAVTSQWLPLMGRPGAYTALGERFDSVVKYLMGGDLPLRLEGLAGRYTANISLLSPGIRALSPAGRAESTLGIRYQIDPDFGLSDDELNAGITRIAPLPGSRSAEENPVFAEFSGRIRVPVLSLHTTGDAFVPFKLEQDYRRLTLATGTSDLLVQRAIRRPNHCQFTEAERSLAFDDLVAWLESGAKPEGDDVLTADLPSIGLRWTTPLLPEDPAGWYQVCYREHVW